MENEELTTAPVEEQVEITNEQPAEQTEVEKSTNESDYDDAWDNLDLDNAESVDTLLGDTATEVEDEGLKVAEKSEEAIATKAFMDAAPVLKFKGKDIPIDSPEEIVALAQKGFLMESEQAKIKPYKKMISTVSDVPLEVLQAVADLNSGKQEALEYLKDHYGIASKQDDDYFGENNDDVKADSTYTPEVKEEDPVKDYWDSVVSEDSEMAAKVNSAYKDLDPAFQNQIYDPALFPAFVESVKSGEFDRVYPIAMKERMLNPALDWVSAYQSAAGKTGQQPERNEPPASAQQPRQEQVRRLDSSANADAIWDNSEAFEKMSREIYSQG